MKVMSYFFYYLAAMSCGSFLRSLVSDRSGDVSFRLMLITLLLTICAVLCNIASKVGKPAGTAIVRPHVDMLEQDDDMYIAGVSSHSPSIRKVAGHRRSR
jgi:hypothetical protein